MTHLAYPLVAALLAFVAGLLPALRFSFATPPFLIAGLAALVAAHLNARRSGSIRAASPELLLLCAFGAAGAGLGSLAARDVALDCRGHIPDGTRLRVQGVLGAAAGRTEAGQTPLLPLLHARLQGSGVRCTGEVRVRLPDEFTAGGAGTRVALEGEWVTLGAGVLRSSWPADRTYAGFVATDSVIASYLPDPRSNPLLTLRGRTDDLLQRLFPRHGAMAEALLLGRRERVDPELRDRFARSGLVHLLAISGSHVGLLAGMVILLGTFARLSRRRLAWVTLVSLAVYLAMIGAPASAVRSGIMLALGLVATVMQRPSAAAPIVAATALVILAIEPMAALDPGFQLSFAGVLGLVGGRVLLLGLVPKAWREGTVVGPISTALVVSASAFVATAPITAHHFAQIAPVAVPANVVAVPLMAVVLAGVVGAVVLAPLAFPVARLVADGAGAGLDLLSWTAAVAADLPYGHLSVTRPVWWVWLLTGGVLLLVLDAAARMRKPVRLLLSCGAAVVALLILPLLAGLGRSELEVHFIDVGQGDAVAIRTPAGRWLLIDAGPRSQTYDAGARRVLPFLRAHGARRLEALVLTHPDLDHIGGALAVLRGMPVGKVIEPGLPVGKQSYLEILREIEARSLGWHEARSGRVLTLDGVRLEFLWPLEEALDGAEEANQISAVTLLKFFDFSLLLTGDVDESVEHQLVTRHGGGLRAQVLKAGHHGSASSTSAALLNAVQPELVVISVGRRNRYGHPAPDVLRRLDEGGIRIARTDREGSVTLRVLAEPGGHWRRAER